jgi:hypothetical protein
MPIKLFTDGEVLTASSVNTYFMDQALCIFDDATARDAAFGGAGEPTLQEGRICYLKSDDTLYIYTGSTWTPQLVTITDGSVTEAKIASGAVTASKIASSVAGNGLAGGAGTALSVNVDGSTIEINTDSLRVKDGGIGSTKLASSLSLTTPTLGVASATSINKVAITAPATSATLTLSNGSTLATSGGHSITLVSTGSTNVTLPTTGTLATLTGVEQLENKTLISPVITGGTTTAGEVTVLIFEGTTVDGFETTLNVIDPTADRTISLPNASGTVALSGSIALGTDTTGNYMSGVTSGTGVSVSHTPGEGSSATISIGQAVATTDSPTFAGLTADSVRIGVTAANEIDTSSGNLILDSFTGTTQVDDNVLTTGTITVRAASTQDSVVLQGRSGGTSSYSATLTPAALSASRTFTLPNVSGTFITSGDTDTVTETMIDYATVPQQFVQNPTPTGKSGDIWIKIPA